MKTNKIGVEDDNECNLDTVTLYAISRHASLKEYKMGCYSVKINTFCGESYV